MAPMIFPVASRLYCAHHAPGSTRLETFQFFALRLLEIPNSRREVLPGASHMANLDAPDAFNRTVLEFLAGN